MPFAKLSLLTLLLASSSVYNSAERDILSIVNLKAAKFNVSLNTALNLISYANLAFDFGSLLLMPLYASLIVARIIHSFKFKVYKALLRLFFYVEFAFTIMLFIFAFFVVEEIAYRRTPPADISSGSDYNLKEEGEIKPTESVIKRVIPSINVIITYGIYISLRALTFNFIFLIKITYPPYNWSETNFSLITITSFLDYLLAIPFTLTFNRLATHLTHKNNGIRKVKIRLGAMLPVLLLPIVNLIVFSIAAEKNLPYFYFTFTLAYIINSYNFNILKILIAINLKRGYAAIITGIFNTIVLVNNLYFIIFII
ncbi:hypothetical protein QBC46DRAFT_368585 [Diplogelasinospora grovesii]|uniref:Uncharacterized protein n=1 Tax=Diplogelasinospora grovesii TaxID=303347 RepID=A0AAN6RYE7_9PEZI|nr:hypothetical protein QBC46DRAFT_368585 [Diplogelasinospora grovesii]